MAARRPRAPCLLLLLLTVEGEPARAFPFVRRRVQSVSQGE